MKTVINTVNAPAPIGPYNQAIVAGDFIFVPPYVPHQELNLDASETLDFVVVRSDNEKIVVNLDVVPIDQPESVF